ncbi:amidohydrolase [Marivivens aquimaris]|uniref:amidohydrolase n=1 Tax=Marivivens aquimaris TaxID=2774876 RepID=UPI00188133E9|nr:amidohydrolase [Marivivens aquimaris]
MTLLPDQISYLTDLRQALHRQPEISGEEEKTAASILEELEKLGPDRIWTDLGGHGVAAEFAGAADGPTVLLRCELDGLPIREISEVLYKSEVEGKGHLCGHDGHMVSMLGVAMHLGQRPATGRVILLFQPAEETGAGAQAVIDDPRWPEIKPDYAFAYHNVPARPLGEIGVRAGSGNCASRGMQILLEGKSSHAAAPEDGLSPGPAMAALMNALPALSHGVIGDTDFALSTLTHANLGEPTFGIAPADGELRVTLRCMTNERMEKLIADALALVDQHCTGLRTEVHWHDIFRAVVNDEEATAIAAEVAHERGHVLNEMQLPMRWSEDFGRFGDDGAKAAMLYIGSGENCPQLHNADYDFPDALLPTVIDVFCGIVDRILGTN